MSRDDFDLGDFGDFEEPSFPEEEFLPPEQGPGPGPQRNTAFLIVAALLVLVFLAALAGIAALVIQGNEQENIRRQTVEAVYATNTAVQVAIFATETAKAWTATPSPTMTPTDTPTPTATETLTPTLTETPTNTPDVAGTQTAAALTQAAALVMPPIDVTHTAEAMATSIEQTNIANTQAAATFGVGGPASPTPDETSLAQTSVAATLTAQVITPGTQVSFGASATPGPARPTQATATRLPQGGFFDDVAAGKASPNSLAVVGFAALGLVSIIIVARRLRVRA